MNRSRERTWLAALVSSAVLLRVMLAAFAPTPYGYVWDFYHQGVQVLYERGRLPVASDCWACSYPPLFYVLGWPLYAAGRALQRGSDALALRFLGALPLVSGAVIGYYGYRLLRWFRRRGTDLVIGAGILFAFPCLVISSYGVESDIVVSAILSAFLFYLARDASFRPPATAKAVRLGALAGLAAATKYSGLLGILTLAMVHAWHIVRGRRPALAIQGFAVAAAMTAAIGGWKYFDNLRWYGTPMYANGSALKGFSVQARPPAGEHYEFFNPRLRDLASAVLNEDQPGRLTDLAVYRSVPATLHGLAWSDLGFFSIPGRHGDPSRPYPRKRTVPLLTAGVLLLACVPDLLAMAGAAATMRRRSFGPVMIFSVLGLASYVWWFLAQEEWALKTKYILFLLPAFVVYVTLGLAWVRERSRAAGRIAIVALGLLVVMLHAYLLVFALG